jgi:two-component system, NarL family, nitrate/nitrite sensor histidine kinase NarX
MLMRKKTIPVSGNAQSDFLWLREPEFTPPETIGSVEKETPQDMPRIGELKTLLKLFLDNLVKLTGAASAVLRLLSPDGRTPQIISSSGFPAELSEESEIFKKLNCQNIHNAALSGDIQVLDINLCNSKTDCPDEGCHFQSLIVLPLKPPHPPGTPLGILSIFYDAPREPTIQNRSMIETLAEMMSAAIEHTHVNREARRIELINERQAIANDIHDSLAQTLTYARMRVSMLIEANRNNNKLMTKKYASDLDEALEISQKNARELVTNFRSEIHRGGLSAALNDLANEFRKRNNIVLEYHNRLADLELPLEHEIQTYHIVHEALNNIARHSGATHARLFVDAHCGYYVFTIEDNGSGACTFAPVEGHYGVLIMRERANQIGGTIKVESATGQGTQVQLYFPEPSLNWRATNE